MCKFFQKYTTVFTLIDETHLPVVNNYDSKLINCCKHYEANQKSLFLGINKMTKRVKTKYIKTVLFKDIVS